MINPVIMYIHFGWIYFMSSIKTVDEIKDFIKKEWELRNHHKFAFAYPEETIVLLIDPHLICKKTNRVEDDPKLNDTLQYWVEVLVPFEIDWSMPSSEYHYVKGRKFALRHDMDLDCGGYSYEEVILNAHKLMTKKYGATSEALYDMAIKNRLNKMNRDLKK